MCPRIVAGLRVGHLRIQRFADSLARQKGVEPPPGYKTSISICRKFLANTYSEEDRG